jgi:hypothetical protein
MLPIVGTIAAAYFGGEEVPMSKILRPVFLLAVPLMLVALTAPVQAGSALARATSPMTPAVPFLQLVDSDLPFASSACVAGQVLNELGESCLTGVLPPLPLSLLGTLPGPRPTPAPPLSLPNFILNGSNCLEAGQILQPNGDPCVPTRR